MKRKSNIKAMIIIMILGVAIVNSIMIFLAHRTVEAYDKNELIFNIMPMHEFLSIILSTFIIFVSMVILIYFMRNIMIDALESLNRKK